jgi:hypothetical protein
MTKTRTRTLFTAATVGLGLIAVPAVAAARSSNTTVHAELTSLNRSGVTGTATVTVTGNKLDASIDASGLLADAPHAAHIHFGETALHECPTQAADGGDGQLTTGEGLPFYGPVVVSFTTSGATGPAAVLAIDRFSTAPGGVIDYDRQAIKTERSVAKAIAAGEGVVVIHGVDYNDNGAYDLEAGVSDLDSSLPAEATDLAACGVLHS